MLLSATEVSFFEAQQVDAVLLKSRVSQQDLLEQLRMLLEPARTRQVSADTIKREAQTPLGTGAN
jgi:hypothetical protein